MAKGDKCGIGACDGGTVVCAPPGKDGKSTGLVCSTAGKKADKDACDNQSDDDCDGILNNGCSPDDIDNDGVPNSQEDAACSFKFAKFHAEIHPNNTRPEPCCPTGKDCAAIGLALKSYPAEELEHEVMRLANRMGMVDPHLLSANKRLVNLGLELMGARTLQRIGAEIDARGHLAPKAMAFKATMRQHGVKHAFQARDAAFGSGYASVTGRDPD